MAGSNCCGFRGDTVCWTGVQSKGCEVRMIAFFFSISVVKVKLQTPVNNQVFSKGANRSPKTFIKAVAISICTGVIF